MKSKKKETIEWTTMEIRKDTRDILNLFANYEHRASGEMVAVMMRGYLQKTAKDMDLTVDELKTFLTNYERD